METDPKVDIWHIGGQGSIGLLLANQLRQQHCSVTLISRHHQGAPINQTAKLTGIDGKQHQFTTGVDGYQGQTPIDNLLLPLKAFDIQSAFKGLAGRLTANARIVLCHNGMGTIEQLKPLLTVGQSLYFASTSHGAYRPAPHHVIHSGLGATNIGLIVGSQTQPPDVLTKLLPPVSFHQDLSMVLWQKLAINCIINPLTAIEQCRNGQLAERKFNSIIEGLCEEIALTAQGCGIPLRAQQIEQQCRQVIIATANNYSSMRQDVAAGRPTEIDFITGYLLDKAAPLKINTPLNARLYRQIDDLSLSIAKTST